jgi:hypothetical protein
MHGAGIYAGGMYNRDPNDPNDYVASNPTVVNCVIANNSSSTGFGGGIHCADRSALRVVNCTITGNSASWGGGISSWRRCRPLLLNTIIWGNQALRNEPRETPGLMISGRVRDPNDHGIPGKSVELITGTASALTDINGFYELQATGLDPLMVSFPSGRMGAQIVLLGDPLLGDASTAEVNFCDIEGGNAQIFCQEGSSVAGGWGNVDADPLFAAPNGPDGDPRTWQDNDFHLSPNSPCINVGLTLDPNDYHDLQTDIDGQPRVIGGRVDIGADEVQAEEGRAIFHEIGDPSPLSDYDDQDMSQQLADPNASLEPREPSSTCGVLVQAGHAEISWAAYCLCLSGLYWWKRRRPGR